MIIKKMLQQRKNRLNLLPNEKEPTAMVSSFKFGRYGFDGPYRSKAILRITSTLVNQYRTVLYNNNGCRCWLNTPTGFNSRVDTWSVCKTTRACQHRNYSLVAPKVTREPQLLLNAGTALALNLGRGLPALRFLTQAIYKYELNN